MAGFPVKKRQSIIDGYLSDTRRNHFNPAEFIDWLEVRPDHEAYSWFFGMDDATAAREHRIAMARSMANGLRVVARVDDVHRETPLSVTVREFPAMISPVADRKHGGGYQPFSPDNPVMVDELRRQGAQALRSWLARYRGVAELGGMDVSPIEKIAAILDGSVADAA